MRHKRHHAVIGGDIEVTHWIAPAIPRGGTSHGWAPPCGSIVIQADQGYACTQSRYFASLGVCNTGTPVMGSRGGYRPRHRGVDPLKQTTDTLRHRADTLPY